MKDLLPDYLAVAPQDLARGTPVRVTVRGDMADVARHLAETMFDQIVAAHHAGKPATLIVPVGPVDQYPILAERIVREQLDCRDVCFINMDEYLTDDDRWIDVDHPLSFRGFMNRLFYDRLDPALAPREENRVFPHPDRPDEIQQIIDARGGVDVCFGGIGINGHIAFNEPPEPGEEMGDDAFAQLPTRVLSLSRETRTINSVTVGGEIAIIPRRAVTVGMKECLAAKRVALYCNRPWQSAVVRRVLHGPITAQCPASLVRRHRSASITISAQVATAPEIRLR